MRTRIPKAQAQNFKDTRTSNIKRREKYEREERRFEEEAAIELAHQDTLYWQPVDKADRKHKMKLEAQQTKMREAFEKKALKREA